MAGFLREDGIYFDLVNFDFAHELTNHVLVSVQQYINHESRLRMLKHIPCTSASHLQSLPSPCRMVCGNRDFKSRHVHSCYTAVSGFIFWRSRQIVGLREHISLNTSQLHVCIIVKIYGIYIYICATHIYFLLNINASKAKGMIY